MTRDERRKDFDELHGVRPTPDLAAVVASVQGKRDRAFADSGRTAFVVVATEIDALLAAARERDVLEKKAATSLANNLCPDHRDKQAGKPCLACEAERLARELAAVREALASSQAAFTDYIEERDRVSR